MTSVPRPIAIVSPTGDARSLALAFNLDPDVIEASVVGSDDDLDCLQDKIYSSEVATVLLESLEVIDPDVMVQEVIIGGWKERGIEVLVANSSDSDQRRGARAALDEIDEYGKIPWIP